MSFPCPACPRMFISQQAQRVHFGIVHSAYRRGYCGPGLADAAAAVNIRTRAASHQHHSCANMLFFQSKTLCIPSFTQWSFQLLVSETDRRMLPQSPQAAAHATHRQESENDGDVSVASCDLSEDILHGMLCICHFFIELLVPVSRE
jgi:hypothetical protein